MSLLDRITAKILDPFKRALARVFLACDRSNPVARPGQPAPKTRVEARIRLRDEGRRERREIKRLERRVREGRAA
jgi:hypothetical protein